MGYIADSSLPELIAQIEALGITYRRASWADDPVQERLAADEFVWETDHLCEMIEMMTAMDEITGQPTKAEIHSVHLRLFQAVMDGEWNATEDELKEILFDVAPQLRV
jgi:hypothetical protein